MKKIVMSTAIAASVIVYSAAAFAASNSAPTASPLSIASVNQAETEAQAVHSANIEYVKETMTLSDGTVNAIIETWVDPITHDKRVDYTAKEAEYTQPEWKDQGSVQADGKTLQKAVGKFRWRRSQSTKWI